MENYAIILIYFCCIIITPLWIGDDILELRVLQYFLAVAREKSISAAAESLHLAQPTLSTQLKALEDELGKPLLIRGVKGSRKVLLTDEGLILKKRAEEIFDLVRMTENEISLYDEYVAGDVYIGAGESDIIRVFAKCARILHDKYPDIRCHIQSGNAVFVMEQLDKGLIDFGMIYGLADTNIYNTLKLPYSDLWGVLMRKDSPLAQKDLICPDDLYDQPLIISAQATTSWASWAQTKWFGRDLSELNVIATYNLIYNASLMVDEGLGVALCFDKLVNTTGESNLCFRPLRPEMKAEAFIIWKKYKMFSKAAQKFIDTLNRNLTDE